MTAALKKQTQLDIQKQTASEWFKKLRNDICAEFEDIDGEGKFERKLWQREGGGGGEMSVMHGKVFEKVGVNISTVYGTLSEQFQKELPGADKDPNFWASGISLVAHMQSPHVPAVHFNTRFICVGEKTWFGGGGDLNPMFPIEEETKFFHEQFKLACDKHDPTYYEKFSKWCDDYFYIKHRQQARGVGGIFYDYLNTGNWDNDFAFTQDVGKAFLKAYAPIARKNKDKPWTEAEREHQLRKRGLYAEFNLVYDRGTRFGFMTNGNTEAILMSLPPVAKWP
jgi:coproporphyrinogen III oxidase